MGNDIFRVPVYKPSLNGNERKYLIDCIDAGWISSGGKYVGQFEENFAKFTGSKHAISVFNGSVALHLALMALGIGDGDEVLVPTFTYIASVNAIKLAGATPVFVEANSETWLIDLDDAKRRITKRTRAIMPVHLYGMSACTRDTLELAARYNLKIIDDAAEAVGTLIDGVHAGKYADAATFSFFGNKTLTCGEGGMIITDDDNLAEFMRITRNHGMSPTARYWHTQFGVNYRMTNMQAAIGVAQLERADKIVARKQAIYQIYRDKLVGCEFDWQTNPGTEVIKSNQWLVSFLAPNSAMRDNLINMLALKGIDTRPVFHCAHKMPIYFDPDISFPVSEDISARGISLPSYPDLTDGEINHICRIIKEGVHVG